MVFPYGLEPHTTIHSILFLGCHPTPISPRESGQWVRLVEFNESQCFKVGLPYFSPLLTIRLTAIFFSQEKL